MVYLQHTEHDFFYSGSIQKLQGQNNMKRHCKCALGLRAYLVVSSKSWLMNFVNYVLFKGYYAFSQPNFKTLK